MSEKTAKQKRDDQPERAPAAPAEADFVAGDKVLFVPVEKIDPPELVARDSIDQVAVKELADSIREVGLMHPLHLRRKKRRFEIIAGHRRFLALRMLGRVAVPAFVVSVSDVVAETMKNYENDARENLSRLEVARHMERVKRKFGSTNRQLAKMFGRSEQAVGQHLAILDWPEPLRDLLGDGVVSFSAARELAKIADVAALESYCHFARESGCTPRLAMQWRAEWEAARSWQDGSEAMGAGAAEPGEYSEPLGQCFLCAEPAAYAKLVPVFCIRLASNKSRLPSAARAAGRMGKNDPACAGVGSKRPSRW